MIVGLYGQVGEGAGKPRWAMHLPGVCGVRRSGCFAPLADPGFFSGVDFLAVSHQTDQAAPTGDSLADLDQ